MRISGRQFFVCILVILLLIGTGEDTFTSPSSTMTRSDKISHSSKFDTSDLIEIEYMAINGNDELLQMATDNNWPGTGYEWDPIIIEGYHFRGYVHHFVVDNTDLYWEFKNNILDGIDDRYCEIVIGNLRNGKIANNYFVRGAVGIHGIRVEDCVFSGNKFYNQSWDGVLLEYSNNNIIIGNTFIDEGEGGVLGWVDSKDNNILYNTVHGSPYGFMFWEGSNDNTVQQNTIHDISIRGVDIQTTGNIVRDNEIYNIDGDGISASKPGSEIRDNLIYNGERYGINLYSGSGEAEIKNNVVIGFEAGAINLHESDDSRIELNDFYDNGEDQAWDYGNNNIFTDNYWHEWIANDTNENGILDLPKLIAGGDNTDPRPHAIPINPIPSWYDFKPITGPHPPDPDPTETTSLTTETSTTIDTSNPSASDTNTTQVETDGIPLSTWTVGIGASAVLVIVAILVSRKKQML